MAVYITEQAQGELLAKITGEIDHHTARWLRSDIDTAIEDRSPKKLYLDFSGVSFMDSSGVGLVMGRYKNMRERGGRVYMINMPEYIEKVMNLAGMDRLLNGKEGDFI